MIIDIIFYHILLDENLIDRDWREFGGKKEEFRKMQSIEAITLRCIDRGVFQEQPGERILDCLSQNETNKAAGKVFCHVLKFLFTLIRRKMWSDWSVSAIATLAVDIAN